VPADGSPCTSSAIGLFACEYNGNAMGQCATVAECYADGKWHVALPANTCGVNPSECPASFSALAEGSPCPLMGGTGACFYPEGGCGCKPCASDGGMSSMWTCRPWSSAGAGCPAPRPLLGSVCSQEGLECSYTQCCTVSLGKSEACKNGHWQSVPGIGCSCALIPCK
jgi:hypothetical protein